MSMREQACALIEKIPSYKMAYVIGYLQGIMADDEAEDDLFCEQLYQNYLNDPDRGEYMAGEDLAKELGIAL